MARKNMPAGPGRPKGSQNKVNTELKEMIRAALDKAGGAEYLFGQALNNPTSFMTLLGKTIPSDVNARLSGGVKVNGTINFIRPNRD